MKQIKNASFIHDIESISTNNSHISNTIATSDVSICITQPKEEPMEESAWFEEILVGLDTIVSNSSRSRSPSSSAAAPMPEAE